VTSPTEAAVAVLRFWFQEVGEGRWFDTDPALDAEIEQRFAPLRREVLGFGAAGWQDSPDTLLAAIILLDQFSRNIFRGQARAFEADALALSLAKLALDRGWTDREPPARRQFFLMPLMHSENLADQQRCVAEFAGLGAASLRYAQLHRDQIERFGRFPGRNQALGRVSSAEEREALADGAAF
jgi:uncharacterized protein (DUF924 family)